MTNTIRWIHNLTQVLSAPAAVLRHNGCSRTKITVVTITLAAAIGTVAIGFPPRIQASNDDVRIFTVDVATGLPYMQNNVNPAEPDPEFSAGDTYFQDGNVYPAGSIAKGSSHFDPNAPGAIGKFRARGVFTNNLAAFNLAVADDPTAPHDMAFGTEMYTLHTDKATLLTEGTQPNPHFSVDRVVVGGTGSFRDFVGEVHEENLGENSLGFCNFRVTFKLRRVHEGYGR
ncbi:MAG: hypothetical protein JWN34_3219 [Bryobacterales bacterium]|nr:hypothetical protein [Bryobacterales bacterium]